MYPPDGGRRGGKSLKPVDTGEEFPTPQSPSVVQRSTPGAKVKIPSYRLHRPSGQAVVTLSGRDVYLGRFGSAESRSEYERRMAEWLASGRQTPGHAGAPPDLTVSELLLAFWGHIKASYRPETIKGTFHPALRRLRRMYGSTRVADFGPLKLKAFRQALLDEREPNGRRLSRPYVNRLVRSARGCFRWGVGEELVPPGVLHALQAVDGLRMGRGDAPEPEPVTSVADAVVAATLPHLPGVVADMVRLQRLTGMRPGELCRMTPRELDTSGEVWLYTPRHHKTAHHGKSRVVPIGPRAQAILREHLQPDLEAPIFSPEQSEAHRKQILREQNRTPFTPSRLARDAKRARRPRRMLNAAYTTTNYAQAIRRACEAAGIASWAPNQLRHSRATELRRQFGLDAAGAVLGHAKLETTQIYAERAAELAVSVARQTG